MNIKQYTINPDKIGLIFSGIVPVNKWKTAHKFGYKTQIVTDPIWTKTKILLNTLLKDWHPDNKDFIYSLDYSVPLKDRKDIDAGVKFVLDSLQGKYYNNDRQVKEININIHDKPYYEVVLKIIGNKTEWKKTVKQIARGILQG